MDKGKARQPFFFTAIEAVAGFIEKIAAYLCGTLVFVMFLIVILQIFSRAVQVTVSWTEEASRYILIWIGMLAAGIALKEGGHAAIGFVVDALPKKFQRVINLLIVGGILFFTVIFFKTSLQAAIESKAMLASAFEMTMFWPKMALPVGSVVIILNCLYLMAYDLMKLIYGEKGAAS